MHIVVLHRWFSEDVNIKFMFSLVATADIKSDAVIHPYLVFICMKVIQQSYIFYIWWNQLYFNSVMAFNYGYNGYGF